MTLEEALREFNNPNCVGVPGLWDGPKREAALVILKAVADGTLRPIRPEPHYQVNFREEHSAECDHCGYRHVTYSTGEFISAFFLPKRCPGCNTYDPWLHVVDTYRLVKPDRTWNPLTWFGSEWGVVETRSWEVR